MVERKVSIWRKKKNIHTLVSPPTKVLNNSLKFTEIFKIFNFFDIESFPKTKFALFISIWKTSSDRALPVPGHWRLTRDLGVILIANWHNGCILLWWGIIPTWSTKQWNTAVVNDNSLIRVFTAWANEENIPSPALRSIYSLKCDKNSPISLVSRLSDTA